jgi:DNA-directed RNA polymerase, mitochondrial
MFLFADGEPIGEEGIYWLKVHLANCGDDNRISKQAFDERVAWVDRNLTQIVNVASFPLSELWWTKADKPFMFLAACFELAAAIEEGPTYVTHLPVSFDGSCSGLQHLCAMTRAPEGSLVNLTPEERPQDIYQTVADLARELIEADN